MTFGIFGIFYVLPGLIYVKYSGQTDAACCSPEQALLTTLYNANKSYRR